MPKSDPPGAPGAALPAAAAPIVNVLVALVLVVAKGRSRESRFRSAGRSGIPASSEAVATGGLGGSVGAGAAPPLLSVGLAPTDRSNVGLPCTGATSRLAGSTGSSGDTVALGTGARLTASTALATGAAHGCDALPAAGAGSWPLPAGRCAAAAGPAASAGCAADAATCWLGAALDVAVPDSALPRLSAEPGLPPRVPELRPFLALGSNAASSPSSAGAAAPSAEATAAPSAGAFLRPPRPVAAPRPPALGPLVPASVCWLDSWLSAAAAAFLRGGRDDSCVSSSDARRPRPPRPPRPPRGSRPPRPLRTETCTTHEG